MYVCICVYWYIYMGVCVCLSVCLCQYMSRSLCIHLLKTGESVWCSPPSITLLLFPWDTASPWIWASSILGYAGSQQTTEILFLPHPRGVWVTDVLRTPSLLSECCFPNSSPHDCTNIFNSWASSLEHTPFFIKIKLRTPFSWKLPILNVVLWVIIRGSYNIHPNVCLLLTALAVMTPIPLVTVEFRETETILENSKTP